MVMNVQVSLMTLLLVVAVLPARSVALAVRSNAPSSWSTMEVVKFQLPSAATVVWPVISVLFASLSEIEREMTASGSPVP